MVRRNSRRGLLAAVLAFVLVLVLSGPALFAAGPGTPDTGFSGFWNRLIEEVKSLFKPGDGPTRLDAPLGHGIDPDGAQSPAPTSEPGGGAPELGPTIDPDG